MQPVKSLSELPRLTEAAPDGVPQIPDKWRGKSIRGNISDPDLKAALKARNEWVKKVFNEGKAHDEIIRLLQKAGWDIQTVSAIDMILFKVDGGSYPSQTRPLKTEAKPATVAARPERVEIQHAAQEGLDPLVIAIAKAIAPLFHEQFRTLKAKADKWDAIAGLVKDA